MAEMVDMSVADTLLALKSVRECQYAAQAREAELLAHYADMCGHVEQAGRGPREVLVGEQLVSVGRDGTPEIAEFAAYEVAALWNENAATVSGRIGIALDLRHRFPRLWHLMLDGQMAPWLARRIAELACDLPVGRAQLLDADLADAHEGLATGRLLGLAEGLVLKHTPAEQADAKRDAEPNCVDVRHRRHAGTPTGRSLVFARMDSTDAAHLEAQVQRIAQLLKQGGDARCLDDRRAHALGLLAFPAYALQLLQASLLDQLPAEIDAEWQCPSAGQAGHLCGQITVDPDRLLPKAEIVLHLSDTTLTETLAGTAGICRAERLGPLLTSWLPVLFGHHRITVRPVLDPEGLLPVDSYEIPASMRHAVQWRNPVDMFPGSTTRAKRCDLDHTDPYRFGGPPGQTRPDNLAPMSRSTHRAKTFAGWCPEQIFPGVIAWRSPAGFVYLVTPSQTLLVHAPPGHAADLAA